MRTLISLRAGLGVLLFAALIVLSARVSFPLPGIGIPQTGQTAMVLVAGALLGARLASLCLCLYLFAGLVGLPVFADGTAGLSVLLGPSGGYLLGFWLAATMLGYAFDLAIPGRRFLLIFIWMLIGHAVILLIGGTQLTLQIGFVAAWFNGVQPFLLGGLVKSFVAAGTVYTYLYWREHKAAQGRSHGGEQEQQD